jgi:hypothetical protein
MQDNFTSTPGTLADKLMSAMQGANFTGADSRCLARGTSSTSAYLLVYKAAAAVNDPFLRLKKCLLGKNLLIRCNYCIINF